MARTASVAGHVAGFATSKANFQRSPLVGGLTAHRERTSPGLAVLHYHESTKWSSD
jgi:hypothetical protein